MQVTDKFKEIIEAHLQSTAAADPLFAETLKKPAKNITDCVNYILGEVKKTNKMGFADEEVFGMAVHYYDEDSIGKVKPISGRVVVNQSIAGPPKAVDKKDATQPKDIKKAPKKQAQQVQPSLFG